MILDKKEQKDPSQKEIKYILELLNSRKLDDAKKEIDKKILKYPNSSILLNVLGAVLAEENHLDAAIKSEVPPSAWAIRTTLAHSDTYAL